jgi:hypothetical protein
VCKTAGVGATNARDFSSRVTHHKECALLEVHTTQVKVDIMQRCSATEFREPKMGGAGVRNAKVLFFAEPFQGSVSR